MEAQLQGLGQGGYENAIDQRVALGAVPGVPSLRDHPFIVSFHFPPTSPSDSLEPYHPPGPGEIFKHRAKDSVGPSSVVHYPAPERTEVKSGRGIFEAIPSSGFCISL